MNEKLKTSSFTLIVAFTCLSLIGLALIPRLPVKLSPSRVLPRLTVSYSMPGNSSRIVEMEVTSKLEAVLARVNGINKMQSSSSNGSGYISLLFDEHTNMDVARFEVSTIVRQIWPQLPKDLYYPQIRSDYSDDGASRPFMTYTLNAPQDPIIIQQYAEEHMKTVLAQIKGIYKVELSGATPMEWRLEYSQETLSQVGLTLSDIQTAIRQYYEQEFLGLAPLDMGGGKTEWVRLVRHGSENHADFKPENIQVQCRNGNMISLDKLIKVHHAESEPYGYYRINGLSSIYLNLTAEETANQLDLKRRVKETIETFRHQLPDGYEIHLNYDATDYIQKELDKVYFRTGLTVLILLVFILLITLRWRYLLLIVLSLTANLLVAVIFYYLLGVEIQLYSLAGITISLNLMIDATIVMTDHILHRHNLKAFLSILAATLTTVGALAIIFFLDDKIRLNLQDFATVVIINLLVSLFVSLFLVPSLIEKIGLEEQVNSKFRTRYKRFTVMFTRIYERFIAILCTHKMLVYTFLVLLFGLPVFLLPEKLEGEGQLVGWYNGVFDSRFYKEKIKPTIDKALGGTLRLFVEDVYNGSYFNRGEAETVLTVAASMPNGTTLDQMNELIKKMETYLTGFKEIRQFHTSVYNARRAMIQIFFTKESEAVGFPYVLKSDVISKALTLGGGSWEVTGLQDQGFSNEVHEGAGSFMVSMYGYNYDELYAWAERLREKLLERTRIREVLIKAEYSFWKDDYSEYYLELDQERMAQERISPSQLFMVIRPVFGRNIYAGEFLFGKQTEQLKLFSAQGKEYDVWGLLNMPFVANGKTYKLSDLASLRRGQAPQKVIKEDQQYKLCLQYEYIGAREQGRKFLKEDVEAFSKQLPMGYTAIDEEDNYMWRKKDNSQYALLLLVIVIIFFITSILFNSLKQPLAIVFVIPVSYVGVFLTFYLFHLNFDQGGFASFVLLCGITVNASIYILNEYNNIRKRYPRLNKLHAYTKAWNAKVIPISLTVLSTILGFIPFMVGEFKESFWFPLAAGTIGGLIMSVIAIFFFLPAFSLPKKN